jgi:hypothetical protein
MAFYTISGLCITFLEMQVKENPLLIHSENLKEFSIREDSEVVCEQTDYTGLFMKRTVGLRTRDVPFRNKY